MGFEKNLNRTVKTKESTSERIHLIHDGHLQKKTNAKPLSPFTARTPFHGNNEPLRLKKRVIGLGPQGFFGQEDHH